MCKINDSNCRMLATRSNETPTVTCRHRTTETMAHRNTSMTPAHRCRQSATNTFAALVACAVLLLTATHCNANTTDIAASAAGEATTIASVPDDVVAGNSASASSDRRPFRPLFPFITTTTTTPLPPPLIHTKDIQDAILAYIDETLSRRTYQLLVGLTLMEKNQTAGVGADALQTSRQALDADVDAPFDVRLLRRVQRFADTHVLNLSMSRALQAKSFFFKSLKKFMWPMFIGLQVVKTMLLAMFLPSIIGTLGKMVGKGLSSVSAFGGPPADTVENLEFKDNYNSNIDAVEDPNYTYMSPQGAQDNMANPSYVTHMYESANANNALSRFGIGYDYSPSMQKQPSQRPDSASAFGKKTDFKDFHDIPASSMLLTNYDPFYSPLLSRLDAVFQQMSLPAGNEKCREKLVCLMYASPAKYAPYSNLVSAQLSRELNELKKPTTDNPDILRFFKYMRAAKDGQDQVNCVKAFSECTSLQDTDSPAMLTTYNDINKLVQARRL